MWQVNMSKKVTKALPKLPKGVYDALRLLVLDMQQNGAIRGNWKNYSKLGAHKHHCHIKTGRPTYVVVWEEVAGKIRVIEVQYVGTHEKAPY